MPSKLRNEIALTVGALVAGVEAAAALVALPKGLHVAVAVVVAMAGALGIRQRVTPVD